MVTEAGACCSSWCSEQYFDALANLPPIIGLLWLHWMLDDVGKSRRMFPLLFGCSTDGTCHLFKAINGDIAFFASLHCATVMDPFIR